jgi:transposase
MSKIYSDDFKRQIVLLRKSGKSSKELCDEYQLGKNTVRKWVIQYETFGNFIDRVELTKEQSELSTLRQQVRDQQKQINKLENEQIILRQIAAAILKKKR